MEMDSTIHKGWLPTFAKHGDGKSAEPSVGAFVERFGHHIPTHNRTSSTLSLTILLPWL